MFLLEEFSLIVGIDLGTVKSIVGYWDEVENIPKIIPAKNGKNFIPSLVLVDKFGDIHVGWDAFNHPDKYKEKTNYISSVKRVMGTKGDTDRDQLHTYPQEISALILDELKKQAENYLQTTVSKAVISIPSHFDDNQRRATLEAAQIADLEVVRLLNEATAVALRYKQLSDNKSDERILVFDMGGGTTDVSVIEAGEGVYEVLNVKGDSQLGGNDIDVLIANYIKQQLKYQYDIDTIDDKFDKFESYLLDKASELKEALSFHNSYDIDLHMIADKYKKSQKIQITLSRDQFLSFSSDLLDKTLSIMDLALKDSNINSNTLSCCILIGGGCFIPYIQEKVKSMFHCPVRIITDNSWVTQGSVIQGSLFSGHTKEMVLLDIVPASYGIGTLGGIFTPILEKNTVIPTKKSTNVTLDLNYYQDIGPTQYYSEITIQVYTGEQGEARKNVHLTNLILKLNRRYMKTKLPTFAVTIEIDSNMLLSASVKELGTNNITSAIIRAPFGLNQTQISLMKKKIIDRKIPLNIKRKFLKYFNFVK
ncbi:MAG: Chaperone protein DnaK [Candidatus Heimdallarchaeota archaeon LC_3]|nr:MAG: Chaperone protein DnaK [Candidatus Heimdallarchaeota archaeon LC_3]OLS28054.1 MAG: Chaperone protein DnaK [Candidatus Heimdallarchaeota archaeon LC_3]